MKRAFALLLRLVIYIAATVGGAYLFSRGYAMSGPDIWASWYWYTGGALAIFVGCELADTIRIIANGH